MREWVYVYPLQGNQQCCYKNVAGNELLKNYESGILKANY